MKMRPELCLLLVLLTAVSTPADSVDEYVRSEMARRHIPGCRWLLLRTRTTVGSSVARLGRVSCISASGIMRILMSPLFDQVQKQAQLLTVQEKAALAHLLIEELDSAAEADVEQLWIAESRRRYEAYLRGELQSVPGDEAMARARQRIK